MFVCVCVALWTTKLGVHVLPVGLSLSKVPSVVVVVVVVRSYSRTEMVRCEKTGFSDESAPSVYPTGMHRRRLGRGRVGLSDAHLRCCERRFQFGRSEVSA